MHQRQDHTWQGLSPRCNMRCAVLLLCVLVLLSGLPCTALALPNPRALRLA